MQHLTEQQEIDIYANDKFHQLAGMVSRYLKEMCIRDSNVPVSNCNN